MRRSLQSKLKQSLNAIDAGMMSTVDDLKTSKSMLASQDQTPAIQASGLGKAYYPSATPVSSLVSALRGRTSQTTPFWALRPMNLTIKRGEVLGLVGHNGAGKSTLLQMISGTLSPSVGQLQVNGRVAALLELGAGFNPEFTGRENLLLNGPLMGLGRSQLAARLDDIIDFSGIRPFIDRPVKTYSSGMFVRLAFSLATSVDPDILVIDEALSVGDGEFARKSFDRILGLRDSGTTILFCSHSMYQIESLCRRAIWLDHGEVKLIGAPAEVTAAYQEHLDKMSAPTPDAASGQPSEPVVTSPGHARIRRLELVCDGVKGTSLRAQSCRSNIEMTVGFESDPGLPTPNVAVTVNTADGRILASVGSWIDAVALQRDTEGRGTATLRFPAIPLLKGRYSFAAYLFCERGLHIYSAAEKFAVISVEQDHLEQGIVSLPHEWHANEGMVKPTPPADNDDAPQPPMRLPPEWTAKYVTRWTREADKPGVLNLFRQAFSSEMSPTRWDWKYRQAIVWGTAVMHDDEYAAFYGGMPRAMKLANQDITAVQIGDSMVAPAHRGALARTGPLFRSAAAFISNVQELYPKVQLAFGFPSKRVLRLGIKLGLYQQVDAISELRWSNLTPARHPVTKTRLLPHPLGQAQALQIQQLWHAMQKDWPDVLLPVRDAERWRYRYEQHPEHRYKILVVSNRWTGKPLASIVVRTHPDHLEWLDYVGPRRGILLAVRAARMHAAELGLPVVSGWFSSRLVAEFAHEGATVEPTEMGIPVELFGSNPSSAVSTAPLWLMAGDTDFR